jgi:branched-chain amino acid transport system substrate-binding protein
MKKIIALSLTIVMLLTLVACGSTGTTTAGTTTGGTTTAASGGTVKIGHYGPLTGPNSTTGNAGLDAFKLAIKLKNAAGGLNGMQIESVYYDDAGTTEGAVKAVTRLIDTDKVDLLLGSQLSGNLQATGAQVEAAQIPEVGTGVGPVWLDNGWKYLFRALSESTGGVVPLVDAMDKLGTTKLATLVYQDEGSISAAENVLKEVRQRGKIEITTEEVSQPNDTDWTGQLSKIVNTQPNGVMLFVQGEQASQMIKQLRNLGYKGYVYGPETMSFPKIREVGGDAANGIVFFAPHVIPDAVEEANSDLEKAFLEAYVKEYGKLPVSDVAYRVYDGMQILFRGVEDAKSIEGPKVRDAIAKISNLQLMAGKADFTQFDDGNSMAGMQVYITHGGKNILLTKFLESNPATTYAP